VRRAVVVLGVVAALCVLASTALAVHAGRRADRLWLRAHGWELAVPGGRWRLEPATRAIRYDDDALVRAPAVLDVGFCPSATSSSRAFAGILPPQPGAVADVVAATARTWARAIGRSDAPAVGHVRSSRVDLDVPAAAGPCSPTTEHLTVVGRRGDAGVVAALVVRDVGEPDDLTAVDAEAILATLRPASGG